MRHRFSFLLAAALALGVQGACTPTPPLPAGRYNGIELKPAKPKHDFILADTEGRPFAFRQATDGQVTLLFFGYTACPDICPVHMANIAAVLDRLSPGERARVKVVFVSTDPDRDSADRLRTWLSHFDSSFIGVRGPIADVNRIEQEFGLAASFNDAESAADTAYGVGHAGQVLAFTPDDSLRVMYPFGTRQQDWAKDLPRLIAFGAP
ncbi:MAG: SCO family protein [Gemmatimonadaceae bacterium]|nr:SCO family protein [Gemmatimonadaceae bacterium]